MFAEENAKMTDCYFEKKDWRACAGEVSLFHCIIPYQREAAA